MKDGKNSVAESIELTDRICSPWTVTYERAENNVELVFNKTVGLRDTWEKQKPKPQQKQNNLQQSQRKPIEVIKQLGKKYTNYPEEKQQKVKAEIQELASKISYKDLAPLFNTAVKKSGTRIATMISLKVMLENGLERNEAINEFIEKALEDKNELLVAENKDLTDLVLKLGNYI